MNFAKNKAHAPWPRGNSSHSRARHRADRTYAPQCRVTVNGGVENGGPFTGTKPEEVAAFLGAMRNQMGGKAPFAVVARIDF